MVDHALLCWDRIESDLVEDDRNEGRDGSERRSGADRRRGDRRQVPSRKIGRPRPVEPLRAIVPQALEFVTPWQLTDSAH